MLRLTPDWSRLGSPLRHTWSGLGNIDQFRWLVRHDTLAQLRLAHAELGLRHVRAVGMFCDEMRVLGPDPRTWQESHRQPRQNWQIIDACIEALLGIGVKPMFTTTFTPTALASGSATVFTTKSNISPPRDLAAWSRLVTDAVRHVRDQFGADEIATWYFEAWNESNLSGFWSGTQEQWFALWDATYHAVKSVDARLRLGGPSTARSEWLREFLDHTQAAGTPPDYIISHIYNNDSAHGALSPFDGPQADRVNHSPHFVSGVIRGARAQLAAAGFRGEIHWNEWGRSWFPTDSVRETANEAAFIAKTMAEVSQEADYFAYWCLSDIYDQMGYGAEAFFGGYGMMNLQGLRKPSWHAHQLLGRLGTHQVAMAASGGDACHHALATTGPRGAHVLVYDFQPDGTGPLDTRSRTAIIQAPPGAKRALITRVDRECHDIVAAWRALGSPPRLRPTELAQLQAANELRADSCAVRDDGLLKVTWTGPGCILAEFPAH